MKTQIVASFMPDTDQLTQKDLALINQYQDDFDILELRVDGLAHCEIDTLRKIIEEIKTVLKKDLLVTYRTVKQGGKGVKSEEDYVKFIRGIGRLEQVDLIDIEWEPYNDIRKMLIHECEAHQKVTLLSYHRFDETPKIEVLKKTYFNMSKLGAQHLKIAVMPQTRQDVLTLLEALSEASEALPQWVTGISMSQLGVISRTAQEVFGGALTYGSISEAVAPGQLHVKTLSNLMPVYSLVEKR